MDTPNPNQSVAQSQGISNKEQSSSKQPMVYICGGELIVEMLKITKDVVFLWLCFNNARVSMVKRVSF
jgi:hypothetical protein